MTGRNSGSQGNQVFYGWFGGLTGGKIQGFYGFDTYRKDLHLGLQRRKKRKGKKIVVQGLFEQLCEHQKCAKEEDEKRQKEKDTLASELK